MTPPPSPSELQPFHYRTDLDLSDLNWLKQLDAQCFVSTPQGADTYFEQVGSDSFRLIMRQETRLGGLCLLPMGQWFGSQRIPMMGVASVGITPEHRGQGAAIALMNAALQEAYERGFAISTLYAAAQRLYEQAGYGQAGTFCKWSVSTDAIQLRPASRTHHSPSLYSMPVEEDILHPIYQSIAAQHQGWCDRHPSIWRQKTTSEKVPLYAYGIGPSDHPQGYILFLQRQHQGQSVLQVLDWVASSAQAGEALWRFLQSHRSQIDQIQWRGGIFDPMVDLLLEQTATLNSVDRWMTRIVNVPLALEARGYPETLTTKLHLHIDDPWISANSGEFVLTVEKGRGRVTAGGSGTLRLDINALASLYTGFLLPSQLQWQGRLVGDASSMAIATQLFTGSSPAMPDFF